MSLSESLLPEFDHEMANTRKVLERIPEDKLNWKVHPKSNTIGWVGMHLAEIPSWAEEALNHDSWDVAPVEGQPYRTPAANSRQAILDRFDKNVAAARAAIAAASRDAASGKHRNATSAAFNKRARSVGSLRRSDAMCSNSMSGRRARYS